MSEATGNPGSSRVFPFVEYTLKSARVNVGGSCKQVPPDIYQTCGDGASIDPQGLRTRDLRQARKNCHHISGLLS